VKDAFVKPERSTWSDPSRGGGYGHGQTTHLLGLVLWLTGLEAERVTAEMVLSPTSVDVIQALAVRFRNGATGAVSGSAGVPHHLGYQVDVRVFGTEGMLMLDFESGRERMEVRRQDRADQVRDMSRGEGTYECVKPLARFIELIQGKAFANPSTAELGARVVELLDAAYRSAASGAPELITRRAEQARRTE
jgi:predicted dehydrogenase